MRQGFIRSFTKTLPGGGGEVEFFEVIELIGGREHRSSEGWSLKMTHAEAVQAAADQGVQLVD